MKPLTAKELIIRIVKEYTPIAMHERTKQYVLHETSLEAALAQEDCRGYTVFLDEKPIAFVLLRADKNGVCCVWDLRVDEAFRRRGIASLLLEQVKKDLKKLTFHTLSTTVREGNEDALEFFEVSGFKLKETVTAKEDLEYKLELSF